MLGASIGTVAVIVVLVILGIVLFGGTGKKKPAVIKPAASTQRLDDADASASRTDEVRQDQAEPACQGRADNP